MDDQGLQKYLDLVKLAEEVYNGMSVQECLSHIDAKIAKSILSRSKYHPSINKVFTEYKAYGMTDNVLIVAGLGCNTQGREFTSGYTAIAACCHWCLGGRDALDVFQKDGFSCPTFEGRKIRNPLADADGIPDTTNLYYVYNLSIGSLFEEFPVMSLALLEWREKHWSAVTRGPERRLDVEKYCEKTAQAKNISVERVIDDIREKIKEQKIDEYLERVEPRRGSRT